MSELKIIGKFEPEDDNFEVYPGQTYIGRNEEEDIWVFGPYYPEPLGEEGDIIDFGNGIQFTVNNSLVGSTEPMWEGNVYMRSGISDVDEFIKKYIMVPQYFSQDSPDGMQRCVITPRSLKYKIT